MNGERKTDSGSTKKSKAPCSLNKMFNFLSFRRFLMEFFFHLQ